MYFHRNLQHPNIIKLFEYHAFDGNYVLVLERPLDCMDLFEYLVQRGDDMLSEGESRTVFQQLLDAVVYLDRQGIVHHDIKPQNILMDFTKHFKVKLIDFGLARQSTKEPITDFFGKWRHSIDLTRGELEMFSSLALKSLNTKCH